MQTVHQLLLTDEYAAEAQGIVIAENSTLRLLYKTAWIRWGSRILFACGIVFCMTYGLRLQRRCLPGLHGRSPAEDEPK